MNFPGSEEVIAPFLFLGEAGPTTCLDGGLRKYRASANWVRASGNDGPDGAAPCPGQYFLTPEARLAKGSTLAQAGLQALADWIIRCVERRRKDRS